MTASGASAPAAPLAPAENVTVGGGGRAGLMAASTVVPPGVTAPPAPCQEIVQPPVWLPRLSALLPATWRRATVFARGSVRPRFLSRTTDSRTACRATARCSAHPNH